jgi:hypothetical protein
MCRG